MARGTESKKNKRQESDQTVLTTRKRLPKRLIVLVKPKKWRVRQKISGASRLTCASHLSTSDASDMMNFWNNLVNIYDKLSLIAQYILAAPASQAYVERGFLCAACLLLVAETEWPSHCKCQLFWNWTKKYWRTQASMPLCELWNFNFSGNGL